MSSCWWWKFDHLGKVVREQETTNCWFTITRHRKKEIFYESWRWFQHLFSDCNTILWTFGSDCGSVGRVVTSETRGLTFESCHWQNFTMNIFTLNCWKDKQKKQRPWMATLKINISNGVWDTSIVRDSNCGHPSPRSPSSARWHDKIPWLIKHFVLMIS